MYIHVYTHKYCPVKSFCINCSISRSRRWWRSASSTASGIIVGSCASRLLSHGVAISKWWYSVYHQQKPAKTHVSHEYPTATTLQSECRLLINHWVFWAPYFWDLLLPWSTEVADANDRAGLVFGATVTNSALVETHKLKQVMFEKSETIGRIRTERVIDLWQDNDCQGQRTINND